MGVGTRSEWVGGELGELRPEHLGEGPGRKRLDWIANSDQSRWQRSDRWLGELPDHNPI